MPTALADRRSVPCTQRRTLDPKKLQQAVAFLFEMPNRPPGGENGRDGEASTFLAEGALDLKWAHAAGDSLNPKRPHSASAW